LRFEYFAIIVLAFVTVSSLLGASLLRGMASLGLGLAIGLVGMDSVSGFARYTVGVPELIDGIDVVLVAVGLFAVSESLYNLLFEAHVEARVHKMSSLHMTKDDWRRSVPAWIRGTLIGFPFGSIPAGGAEIPTFLSYATERKLSKHPEDFAPAKGKGAIEGVAGPEAANNASSTGALVPLLTMGIPTSATAAVLLAAFQSYNLQPGPLLFLTSGDVVWGLIASLYVGNVILLVLNLPLVRMWVKLLTIPKPYLYAGILVFATIGVYSMRQSAFDLVLMFLIGWLGVAMRHFDFPVAPVIVGMILGPMAEKQFRLAMGIAEGDWLVFMKQPISATLVVLTVLVLFAPHFMRRRGIRLGEDD
jgi:putative tricarboxylic transport membrane protein